MVYGCRTGEAAARIPKDIKFYRTFATSDVTSQEIDGRRNSRLKTTESRRVIVLSFWGRTILEKCIAHLPPTTDTDATLTSKNALSAWIKGLLLRAGAEEDDFDAARRDMIEQENALDRTLPEVTAYILRRHFASIARHIMGLSLPVVDRLLGHTTKAHAQDLNSFDTQSSIAAAMERYIFDPALSLNPAYHPMALAPGAEIALMPFSETALQNASDDVIDLEVSLTAAESAETIFLDVPANAVIDSSTHMSTVIWDGIDRLIIGSSTPEKEDPA